MLMDAHAMYKEGNIGGALLKYAFLAELGYEVAQSNVAYILDQGNHLAGQLSFCVFVSVCVCVCVKTMVFTGGDIKCDIIKLYMF